MYAPSAPIPRPAHITEKRKKYSQTFASCGFF